MRSESVEYMANAGGDDDVQMEIYSHFMTNDLLPEETGFPLPPSPVTLPGDLGSIDQYPPGLTFEPDM